MYIELSNQLLFSIARWEPYLIVYSRENIESLNWSNKRIEIRLTIDSYTQFIAM